MTVRTEGVALFGIDGVLVGVEVGRQDGLPGIDIAGLPAASVKEARHRVRSALRAGGYEWPPERLVVNFAPADLPKHGTALDLPLAVALLVLFEVLPPQAIEDAVFFGELGLDGSLRPVPGAVNAALAARHAGRARIFLAPENAAEAHCVPGLAVFAPRTLPELVEHLASRRPLTPVVSDPAPPPAPERAIDLAVIRGQAQARRALEVAAAGRHNLLFIGPPGCGKTLLARALPGLLPPLTLEESLEVTRIHSVVGLTGRAPGLVVVPPFRAPHATASEAALVGGGNPPMPGEVSLAHRGVLFLDEAAEFRRASLDALRAPIEDRAVVISRSRRSVRFPSSVMLVLALNPCPCGHLNSNKPCRCTPAIVRAYQQRLSGPLLDRIDLYCELPAVAHEDLRETRPSESSDAVQARVIAARERQAARQGPALANADLDLGRLEEVAPLGPQETRFLARSARALGISARAWHRVLRVARTIADLQGADRVAAAHLAEALSYRRGFAGQVEDTAATA